ncbi:MAG: lipoprotein insertase outer membrane protein LolB [Methylococcales bacterium]|nr:lipoprotein insertase outer membrane protein LolB [Methylococcales bacterium]
MLLTKVKLILWFFCLLLLSGCSFFTVEPTIPYSKTATLPLYKLEKWSLEGRLSITGRNDSWTANVDWQHSLNKEQIKLSGPLGQGATLIELGKGVVTIDRGDGKAQTSNQPEAFINQQLGLFVPVQSLRYWVIGLPEPTMDFAETATGFKQAGWLIEYKQMQAVKTSTMPYKLNVTNEQVKLKLIVDQWLLP